MRSHGRRLTEEKVKLDDLLWRFGWFRRWKMRSVAQVHFSALPALGPRDVFALREALADVRANEAAFYGPGGTEGWCEHCPTRGHCCVCGSDHG